MRLDLFIHAEGFSDSRARAREMIEAGCVCVNGEIVRKASRPVRESDQITVRPLHPFVSRGGVKLAHGLDHFAINPEGLNCLDVGQSTGGFTDVLLSRGAAHVTGVEVGHGQLHESLRTDPRVTFLEKTDSRSLNIGDLPAPVSLIVCDVSFISITKALEGFTRFLAPDGVLIGLFKPQFEVGRAHIGKGGIVQDKAATDAAKLALERWITSQSCTFLGWTISPIAGGDGNQEWLFAARSYSTTQ